jgi:ferredoxin
MREPESAQPETLAGERKLLGWLLLAVPLLVAAGIGLGWKFSGTASRMHPTVKLAELLVREQGAPQRVGPLAPEDFALERARQNPKAVLAEALQVQRRFAIGSAIFGAWVGLVIGIKLVSLSVRRQRSDYEPDRGSCFGCARCFEYCPNELTRRGLLPITLTETTAPLPRS